MVMPWFLAELFEQRAVDADLVARARQGKRLARRRPRELGRDQYERRQPALFAALALVPGQKPQRDTQRVRPGLLQALPRRPRNLGKPRLELLPRLVGVKNPVLHPGAQVLRLHILAGARLELRRVARIVFRKRLGLRAQLESLPLGEQILEPRDIRAIEPQRLLRRPKVQKPIAQREIEELSLPHIEPRQSRLRGVIGLDIGLGIPLARLRDRPLEDLRSFHLRRRLFFACRLRRDRRRRKRCLRHPRRQRQKPLDPRGAHIDPALEALVVTKIAKRRRLGLVERNDGPGRHRGRVERRHRVERDMLAKTRHVVRNPFGKLLPAQPHAREGMTLHQKEQRMKPRLLQTTGDKHREVQTRPHPMGQHHIRRADLLPDLLEARRRIHVRNVQALQRRIHRRRDRPHALRVLRLISVERRIARLLLQDIARQRQRLRDHRVADRGDPRDFVRERF